MRWCISGKRFKDWDDKPITDITKQDVRNVLDAIIDEGHEANANKTLTILKMLFNWAYDHDKITDVPTDRIKPPGAVTPRERTLTTPKLVVVWNATYGDGGIDSHIYGDIVRILMLTGQRRNEVAAMPWSEIDFERRTWELPRDRTKNKQLHIVPLSSAVLSILRRQVRLDRRVVFLDKLIKEGALRSVAHIRRRADTRTGFPASRKRQHDRILAKSSCGTG